MSAESKAKISAALKGLKKSGSGRAIKSIIKVDGKLYLYNQLNASILRAADSVTVYGSVSEANDAYYSKYKDVTKFKFRENIPVSILCAYKESRK